MSIWGHRDGEPPAEEAHETDPPAETPQAQAPAEPGDQDRAEPLAEVPAVEPPPAFWRAQGEAPVPFARASADAPPLAYGHVPPESPEPAETREPAESPEPAYAGAPGDAPADGRLAPAEVPAPAANGSAADPLLADDVVVLAGETATEEPAPAAEPVVTQPPDAPAAADPAPAAEPVVTQPPDAPASPGGVTPQRWSVILTSFVDDPRGSVTMAADVVDSAVEELVNSVRARQRALGSWRGGETDTEQLRTALRDYRTFWNQVQQMSPAGDGRA